MFDPLRGGRALCAAAVLAALAGLASAAVVSRDLNRQLELIEAHAGGAAVYGTVVAKSTVRLSEEVSAVPFTVLTVRVDQALAPQDVAGELTVYVAGAGEERLSISPPESELREGERYVFFLRQDKAVRAHDAQAYKVDSFAEILRTQANRKAEVVVLGEGEGSAVPANVRLTDLAPKIAAAHAALLAAPPVPPAKK